jgi:hypothetical protein
MNNRKIIELVCLGVLGIVIPHAQADEWNQKTVFTFSGPVEVPGQVPEARTYVFKFMDFPVGSQYRAGLQQARTSLIWEISDDSAYRLKPRGKTIITFEERAAGF